ncbi:hypothetical protein DPMN_115040 [Dreissena polymorpha]|uniref:Uncharacterized protein n=1 Tax=Dreissena polymorpha TaxID=45954 RepID=A0A9D4QSK6_DREPO|nr:hypothetical protein DPMN_115040 [Dreissena polymorpha]
MAPKLTGIPMTLKMNQLRKIFPERAWIPNWMPYESMPRANLDGNSNNMEVQFEDGLI